MKNIIFLSVTPCSPGEFRRILSIAFNTGPSCVASSFLLVFLFDPRDPLPSTRLYGATSWKISLQYSSYNTVFNARVEGIFNFKNLSELTNSQDIRMTYGYSFICLGFHRKLHRSLLKHDTCKSKGIFSISFVIISKTTELIPGNVHSHY
jgi:hypothetical protein